MPVFHLYLTFKYVLYIIRKVFYSISACLCYIKIHEEIEEKFTEPLIGRSKINIATCIKSCAQDDLVITRK